MLVRAVAALLVVAAPTLSGCDNKTDYAKEQEAHTAEHKVIDDGLIQAYLTRHNITEGTGVNQYQRLNDEANNGLYLVKVSDGTGTQIVNGKNVDVKYVGRFLRETNETTMFDNSTDYRVPCGCYNLTVGAGSVIKGWDQGLLEMKKGDRKLLLIPSYLAYGVSGRTNSAVGGVSIPPDEPLLFDMEILDVY